MWSLIGGKFQTTSFAGNQNFGQMLGRPEDEHIVSDQLFQVDDCSWFCSLVKILAEDSNVSIDEGLHFFDRLE